MQYYIIISLCVLSAVMSAAALAAVLRRGRGEQSSDVGRRIEELRRELLEEARVTRGENADAVNKSIGTLMKMEERFFSSQNSTLADISAKSDRRQSEFRLSVMDMMKQMTDSLDKSSRKNDEAMERMRGAVEKQLSLIQEDNGKKLEQMRATVDEKLSSTLKERIGESFKLVGERLEQVYKGLGEMKNLASDVGDLKKVLSNVKTRGIVGEVQLGAILEDIMAPGQYEANVMTKPGSKKVVEYAVKLPGDGSGTVYLPIDSKFPADAYVKLSDAYDTGDPSAIKAAGSELENRIKSFARDIRDKYIDPPNTTDFGIMFLPFEGLYAEVVRRGLLETIQREYRVTIAGPTTLAAMLNSLRMGFRTLAIQKSSGDVWRVLGEVKTEFDRFEDVLTSAQRKITQASNDIDTLVGVRTRQIKRKLQNVSEVPEKAQAAPGNNEDLA